MELKGINRKVSSARKRDLTQIQSLRGEQAANLHIKNENIQGSSTDGDYVVLNEIRTKKKNEEKAKRNKLEEIINDIRLTANKNASNGKTSEAKNAFLNKIPRNVDSSTIEHKLTKYKKAIFDSIESDSFSDSEKHVKSAVSENTDLTNIRDENGLNVLQRAINLKRFNASRGILSAAPLVLLQQKFQVLVKDNYCERNTLHLITEKGAIELADAFHNKVGAKKFKDYMIEESSMEITGQRPRTFPCLHIAAFYGHTDLVDFYIKKGTPLNHLNSKKDTALLWASRWGHLYAMRLLISKGADPNIENDKGSTALYWAVRYNLIEAVEILVKEARADVNKTRKLGFVAPIILASALGYEKIVPILLEAGATINYKIRGGETALHQAAREGHTEVANILIKYGADINCPDEDGNTPLILASAYQNGGVVELLIKNGADIPFKNRQGQGAWNYALSARDNTVLAVIVKYMFKPIDSSDKDSTKFYTNKPPICLAASLGYTDKIKFLIELGVLATEKDNMGNNLMHFAAMNDQVEVLKEFNNFVSIDSQNDHGDTPMHMAARQGCQDTLRYLIDSKAKADIKNDLGETALHVIARSSNSTSEVVRSLVEYIIKAHSWDSLHTQDKDGNSALHIATVASHPEIIDELKVLLSKKTNNEGCTPFHTAVKADKPENLQIMLDIYEHMKGDADLNCRNGNYETVLHLAADAGDARGVCRLIQYGSDLTLADHQGNTVLHRLAIKIVASGPNSTKFIEVLDAILDNLVQWWVIRNETIFPHDNKIIYQQYKFEALRHLLLGVSNHQTLNVINFCAKLGCKDMLNKILMVPDVNYFVFDRKSIYDVTFLTPSSRLNTDNTYAVDITCIEVLSTVEDLGRAGLTLDVPPLKQVEIMYAGVCAWTFAFLMLFHLIYMSLFSWLSLNVTENLRDNLTDITYFRTKEVLLYCIVSIEPGVIILLGIYFFLKFIFRFIHSKFSVHKTLAGKNSNFVAVLQIFFDNMSIVIGLLWAILTITWIVLYYNRYGNHFYLLAFCLWLGWLYSISFTRGFKAVHYFWRMLQTMIIRDVTRFLFVYLFVLLAFAISLHALFQVSKPAADVYQTPLDTIFMTFNLMLGTVWPFEDDFEKSITEAGHSSTVIKVYIIVYLILSTVVLLNVLIAMMNDSYQSIKNTQTNMWRVESIRLGLSVEHYIPWTTKVFSTVRIRRGNKEELKYLSNVKRENWYIEEPIIPYDDITHENDLNYKIKALSSRVDNVSEAIKSLHEDICDIKTTLVESRKL